MCVCSHTRVCLYVSRKRKINFLARAHIASKTDVPVCLCIHVFSDKHLLTLLASAQSLKGNAAWRQTLTHNKRMCQCVCYKKHLLTSLARAHRASGVMLPGGKGSRTTTDAPVRRRHSADSRGRDALYAPQNPISKKKN